MIKTIGVELQIPLPGQTVYSRNDEDFDWSDPWECLQDWFDSVYEKDRPGVWTVYAGETTNIRLIDPAGAVSVVRTGREYYKIVPGTEQSGSPDWQKIQPVTAWQL